MGNCSQCGRGLEDEYQQHTRLCRYCLEGDGSQPELDAILWDINHTIDEVSFSELFEEAEAVVGLVFDDGKAPYFLIAFDKTGKTYRLTLTEETE